MGDATSTICLDRSATFSHWMETLSFIPGEICLSLYTISCFCVSFCLLWSACIAAPERLFYISLLLLSVGSLLLLPAMSPFPPPVCPLLGASSHPSLFALWGCPCCSLLLFLLYAECLHLAPPARTPPTCCTFPPHHLSPGVFRDSWRFTYRWELEYLTALFLLAQVDADWVLFVEIKTGSHSLSK